MEADLEQHGQRRDLPSGRHRLVQGGEAMLLVAVDLHLWEETEIRSNVSIAASDMRGLPGSLLVCDSKLNIGQNKRRSKTSCRASGND